MSSAYYQLKKHRQFKGQYNIELDDEQNALDNLGSSNDLPMEIDVYNISPSYSQTIDSSVHNDTFEHNNYDCSNYFYNNSSYLSISSFGYFDRSPDGSLSDHESPQKSPNTVNDKFNTILQGWAS